jgi:uncharacterized protein YjbJ (UPF0337 family)
MKHVKESTKDRVAGKAHEVKGKVKETAGRMTHDQDLEDDGTMEKVGGKVRNAVGKVEKAAGE